MPHYTDEQIQAANGCDLAAFLLSHGEVLKRCGNQQIWEKHQVWIHGHEWYTHYDAKGGYAVSFVMQYFGLSFQDSIRELLGDSVSTSRPASYKPKPQKELVLPKPCPTMNRVYAYLMNERFIARDVISHFAHAKTLYEDAEYHNCIFVGLDEEGIPRHCHRRGTSTVGKPFKQTEAGSKTEYAFHHDGGSEWLFVFEAPIDMLAFITLHQRGWRNHSYVALCCVSEQAILHRLKVNPTLTKIVLCLDNDNAGEAASERIKAVLAEHGYTDVRILKSVNKDWDEDIKSQNGVSPIRAEASACEEIKILCHALVKEAEYTKQPPMLREKTLSAYTAAINANQNSLMERIGILLGLLLLLAKDECRKCLNPIEWTELETLLCSEYVSYADNGDAQSRLRQLDTDMKALSAVYAKEQMTCDRKRTVSCATCGYSSYEYESHTLSPGDWVSVSDTRHQRTLTCSCGYSITETADHSLTYSEWTPISETHHQRTGSCACGYSNTETGLHNDADGDGYCDDCGYLLTRFSVTVPASLTMTVSKYGEVYAASNAAIVNNSTGMVEVTGITVSTDNGWTLVPYGSNMASAKVDSKLIGFSVNGAQSGSGGNTQMLTLSDGWLIPSSESLPLVYDAVVSALSQPVSEQVLTVVFVLEWAPK